MIAPICFLDSMTKITFKQKLTFISLSIIVTIIFLEVLLRCGGFIFLSIQDYQNHKLFQAKESYRILCIGESTTGLGGEKSYPRLMEKRLNQSGMNKTFKVISKGIPGIHTGYIREHLAEWLDEYRPDMVIAMMGINDSDKPLISYAQHNIFDHVISFLKESRVYKLLQWIQDGLQSRFFKKKGGIEDNKNEDLKERPEISGKVSPQYVKAFQLAMMYKAKKDYVKAEAIFNKLIHVQTNNESFTRRMYTELGGCFYQQEKYREYVGILDYFFKKNSRHHFATRWTQQLCEEHKGTEEVINFLLTQINKDPQALHFYNLLVSCYAELGDTEKAQVYAKKVEDLQQGGANAFTRDNYLAIIKILNKRKVKKIFVQYAFRNIISLKRMLKSADGFEQFVFVDNKPLFQEALKRNAYEDLFSDRFAGDFGHCTSKGNEIIAQNVAEAVLTQLKERR